MTAADEEMLRPADWVALDCVLAVLFAVVFLVGSTRPAYGIPTWMACLLALISTLPAAVRRLWPLPVLGVVPTGSIAAQTTGTGRFAIVAGSRRRSRAGQNLPYGRRRSPGWTCS